MHSTWPELNQWLLGSMGCGNPAVCSLFNLFVQNLTSFCFLCLVSLQTMKPL